MTVRRVALIFSIAFGLMLILWGVIAAVAWWPDYGACLASHQEPRHDSAWIETRNVSCGKDCTTAIVIYHPARDYFVTVCDRYQYPDGCGPSAGRKKAANCR